jgi:hypothetical protein
MMDKNYDLVVIGTGVATTKIAQACCGAGWYVPIVDRRPYVNRRAMMCGPTRNHRRFPTHARCDCRRQRTHII